MISIRMCLLMYRVKPCGTPGSSGVKVELESQKASFAILWSHIAAVPVGGEEVTSSVSQETKTLIEADDSAVLEFFWNKCPHTSEYLTGKLRVIDNASLAVAVVLKERSDSSRLPGLG